jgi:four helix bundle protein
MAVSKNIIKDKSYSFALKSVGLYKILLEQRLFEIASQYIRSATSIGANVEEALAAQSIKDFASKMAIASKEARETNYWLRLIRDGKLVNNNGIDGLVENSEELIKILTSIVKTSSSKAKINY